MNIVAAGAPSMQLPPLSQAFGGELPLGCDPLLPEPRPLPSSCLAFSHARAAFAWLWAQCGGFDDVLLSAYTCPTVPLFFDQFGARLHFIDLFSDAWESAARAQPGRVLAVIPAFLGHEPQVDLARLSAAITGRGRVVVDAAQSAFGHLCIDAPDSVAVISGPRKCLGIADGAVLRMDGVTESQRRGVCELPWAIRPVAAKLAARALIACRSPANEGDALALAAEAEGGWPDSAHRMSDAALWGLSWIDPDAHRRIRWSNWEALAATLGDAVEILRLAGGAPFNLSFLTDSRDELLQRLRRERVFATPLWPGARRDDARHPRTAEFAQRLVGLPIDQRYDAADMLRLGETVARCLHQI